LLLLPLCLLPVLLLLRVLLLPLLCGVVSNACSSSQVAACCHLLQEVLWGV
jgi:hypothetical protein